MQNQHVIGQLSVEIQGASIATAADYQRACSQQVRSDSFLAALNEALDRVDEDGLVWQIPRLEIDLHIEREEQFGVAFLQAFQHAIAQQAAHSSRQRISAETSIMALALHFLENGAMPWNATEQQKSAVKLLLSDGDFTASEAFFLELEQKALQYPIIWLRYIFTVGLEKSKNLLLTRYKFPPELIHWIEELIAERSGIVLENIGMLQNAPNTSLPALRTWQWILQNRIMIAQGAIFTKEKIHEFISHQLNPAGHVNRVAERIKADEFMPLQDAVPPFEEAVFIQNAGLVLLAQFFPILLERTGLVENRQFINEEAQHCAVQLLQYLLTGEEQAWENELLLNKILCNMPGESPVNRFAALGGWQREEADDMLAEVIRQWAVLKNTSIRGLREMFLARDGKLTRIDKNWRLQVERKAVDVLLERLPMGWGYSVIKLPWMEGVLYVEW